MPSNSDWMSSDDDKKSSDDDDVCVLFSFLHVMKLACLVWSQLIVWYFFFERCCIILKGNKGCPLHVVNFCDP